MNKLISFLLFSCSFVLYGQNFSQTEEIAIENTRKFTERKRVVIGPKFPLLAGGTIIYSQKHVVYFPAEMYQTGILEKVEFAFSRRLFSEKGDTVGCKMPIMLKIYARDIVNDIPGEELLKDTIILVEQHKGKKVQIDISKYGIELPSEGIYCGFEAFSTEWYIEHGYMSKDNLSYTTKSQAGGGYAFHTPMLAARGNKKGIYQNYVLGGYAKEWKNVTKMYRDTLLVRLYIRK